MHKIGILGDIHGGHRATKKNPEIIKGILGFVREKMIEHEVPHLIQMGDLFDVRTSIEVEIYNQILDVLKSEFDNQPFTVDILAGNHDLAKKNTRDVSSLRMLDNKELNNIKFIIKPEVKPMFDKYRCLFEPWITNAEDRDLFDSNLTQVDYVFGHFELPFVSHGEAILTQDIDDFYGKKRVFSGHYHNPGVHGDNFLYVGSCVHMTWSDVNDMKYFYIYDFETNELKSYNLNHLFPNFIRLHHDNLDESLYKVLPGANIKMTLSSDDFNKYEEIHTFFTTKFNPASLDFEYEDKEKLLQVQDDVTDINFVVDNLGEVVIDLFTQEYGNSKKEVTAFTNYVHEVEKVDLADEQ